MPFSEYIVKTLEILEVTISNSHELEDDHDVGRNRHIDERKKSHQLRRINYTPEILKSSINN